MNWVITLADRLKPNLNTKMKRSYYSEVIILIILICFNLIVGTKDSETIKQITREDGMVEMSTAVFYFLAACLLIYLFIQSKSKEKIYFLRTKRNFFFLLLGLLCLFFAGEEISWGQRIFNIETPEYFEKYNRQSEINIHNLPFFHGNFNRVRKTGIAYLFNSNALLYEFYFIYFLIIPFLKKSSDKIGNLIEKINLPVTALWIGFLFLLNYFICETIERTEMIGPLQIGEIKEFNFSVLFFIAVISLFDDFNNSA